MKELTDMMEKFLQQKMAAINVGVINKKLFALLKMSVKMLSLGEDLWRIE